MAALLCASVPAQASFNSLGNGPLRLGFLPMLAISAAVAAPGGVAIFLFELYGGRRKWPGWLGAFALAGAAYCVARLLGIGPRGEVGFLLIPLPPLMTLALVCLVPPPWFRLAAVWLVSLLGIGLTVSLPMGPPWPGDMIGLLLGGVSFSLGPWQLAWWLRQGIAREQAVAAEPAPPPSAEPAPSAGAQPRPPRDDRSAH